MFDKPELTFKAVVYKNRNTPLEIVQRSYHLTSLGDGKFGANDNEVLVKIHTAGLNPSDLMLHRITFPLFNWVFSEFGVGQDYAGEVVSIGAKAQAKLGFKVGDKVCGETFGLGMRHTLAEYVNLDTRSFSKWSMTKVPSNLTIAEAGSFSLVYSTARFMVDTIKFKQNSRVLVNGSSTSVGKYVVSLLKSNPNVKEIVGICSARSEPIVKELGADKNIDYTQTPSLLNSVLEECKDAKFDAYLDCTGDSLLLNNLSSFITRGGACRNIAGTDKAKLGERSLLGSVNYNIVKITAQSKLGIIPVDFQALLVTPGIGFEDVNELFESGKIKPFVDSVHSLDNVQDAWDLLVSGKNNGKIVVQIASE